MHTKYIFVTGGVVSGLGKGITAASLGRLLKARGYKVTNQKFDPYINIDPGAMSPYQHGEVFVTDDGAETDLDIGHYERFIDENLTVNSNITTGKIYWSVLNRERKGEYGGDTVQVIPHITNTIKEMVYRAEKAQHSDIVITEIGGTVGDIESLPYLEAIRQMTYEAGRENVLYVHVTLVPYLSKSGEMKSKPTQHSVKELLSIGIQPDIIVCRTEHEMSKEMKDKIALFCNVGAGCVVQNIDSESLYEVPLFLEKEGLASLVCRKLEMEQCEPDLKEWTELVQRQKSITETIEIALVGKYVELHDAYLSAVEALNHAGISNDVVVKIRWISAKDLHDNNTDALKGVSGIIVPGDFSEYGVAGNITAAKYARENKIPFFGISVGLQCVVAEFAKNVAGYAEENISELMPDTFAQSINLTPEQRLKGEQGGAMYLGASACRLAEGTAAYDAYGSELIYERHRHRNEFNNYYRDEFNKKGLVFSGISPDDRLVDIVELPKTVHPWFVGVQFHPEFKSRPNKPHPLFHAFVKVCKA